MSKDMLGPVTRALVGVPQGRLNIIADVANRLNSEKGAEWEKLLKQVVKTGLPTAKPEVVTEFERNEHGHIVLTITGRALSGAEEIERLVSAGYRVGDYAKQCLTSTKGDGYDRNHLLEDGREYKVVLVPHKEIERDSDRTTANLRKLGEKYGYGKPLAGSTPRIRESVSDKQMEEMGIWYIVVLHDPIKDADGDPELLGADRNGDGRWLHGCWDRPGSQWGVEGASAFVVPAS
jgi:hypothetical protein